MNKAFQITGLDGEETTYLTFQKNKKGENAIGMDTGNMKGWLHFWIGRHEKAIRCCNINYGKKTDKKACINCKEKLGKAKSEFISESVHLTREQAYDLIQEIEDRLF